MENLEEDLITFRPTDANRRVLITNANNTGMELNELVNHFIENNSSKHRPVIDKHEITIKSQSEEIESYQEEIESLNEKINTLQGSLSQYKSKVDFLNKEKANFVPDTEELDDALYNLRVANREIVELKEILESLDTDLLEECFEKVEGKKLRITDEADDEYEILTKGDLLNLLVVNYSLHLKGFETDIEGDDEEEEDED